VSIFVPVWTDLYAPPDRRVAWMTTLISAVSIGMIAGYTVAAIFVSFGVHWTAAFYF